MAKLMNWGKFKNCQEGTVFAFGNKGGFETLLILQSIVEGEEPFVEHSDIVWATALECEMKRQG